MDYSHIHIYDVDSSNLSGVGYDPDLEILIVEFTSGGIYAFHGVPPEVYTSFQNAPSMGRYFAANIRHNREFDARKL